MFFVYILRSLTDNKRYIGISKDLHRRLREHNCGKVKSTMSRRPLILIYNEAYKTKSGAMRREKFFKTGKGREYLQNVLGL